MKFIRIDKENWGRDLQKLRRSFRLIGPVKADQDYLFKTLGEGEFPDFNFLNTRLSLKSLVLPQSENMFEYSLDQSREDYHILKEVKRNPTQCVVFGIRPCDAFAFLLVKPNFNTPEHEDPYWKQAYGAITLVGLACDTPCSTCFCTSAGCGPYHEEGLDVLLVQADDHYLAKAITEKGKHLLKAVDWDTETAPGVAEKEIEARKLAAEKRITSFISTDHLKEKVTIDLYDAPFWEDVAFSCINCGICTYVCPTCWCFDIQDETRGKSGRRMRNWDSCMYPLFTLHASGHNPRGMKIQRVRQRFMHKLKYYVDKYNNGIQCVGCGRCIRRCPVNIDIRRVGELMNNYKPIA
ncbi:MAG: 4Fe-4S dicluster domain-containing protein [Desulfobacterales bacterium]|nr:4Fe-4S dicluster domain-containing protein [Desulfobacterales bacterium]